MLKIGVLYHQAKSGRLIVQLSRDVRPGATILDAKGRKLGRVVELIGPVRSPYASIEVVSSRIGKTGDGAFIEG